MKAKARLALAMLWAISGCGGQSKIAPLPAPSALPVSPSPTSAASPSSGANATANASSQLNAAASSTKTSAPPASSPAVPTSPGPSASPSPVPTTSPASGSSAATTQAPPPTISSTTPPAVSTTPSTTTTTTNTSGTNLLVNGGFETGTLTGWQVWPVGSTAAYVETKPHSGTYNAAQYATTAVQSFLYQTVTVPNGNYQASCWLDGSATNAYDLQVTAYDVNTPTNKTFLPVSSPNGYTNVVLPVVAVTSGQIQIGIWFDGAGSGDWSLVDDCQIIAQ